MEKNRFIVTLLVLLMAPAAAWAQTTEEVDTILLTGTVVNRHTQEPVPWCILRFTQDEQTKATVVSDGEGFFTLSGMPAGTYALHAMVHGRSLYQADLDLSGVAYLNISIDTVSQVMLRAIDVVASKHELGPLLINSVEDLRLWGFTAGYRNGNSSVALPPDAHGNIDDGPAEDEGLGLSRGPVFPYGMPLKVQVAYMTGKLGSSFYSGPIWTLVPDVYHPAPDSVAVKTSR